MNKLSIIGSFCFAAILFGAMNANAALVDIFAELGDADKYAVFSSGTFQNDSLVTINGEAAVGPNGSANIAAPSTINGTLYKYPTATVSGPGKVTATVNGVTVVPEVTPGSVIFGFLGLVVAVASRRAIGRQPQRARARKRF